jgi:hypothetical protein
MWIRDPGWKKLWIWGAINLDPGPEIRDKHPDPQHWFLLRVQLNNPCLCVNGLINLNNAASIML